MTYYLLILCVKSLQSKEMYIDIAIDQLKGLINYFKSYRENYFPSVKSMAIEPKHIIKKRKRKETI